MEQLASDTSSFEGGPPFSAEPHGWGNFDERQWGNSVSAVIAARQAQDVHRERAWQAAQLPSHLRTEIMSRIAIETTKRGVRISLHKGPDF